jgi:hypothetical protein
MSDDAETPTADEKQLVAELDAIRAKNQKLLDEAKAAKAKLRAYDGIDPDEYADLLAARDEAESAKAKAAGDWEKREATWQKKVSEKDSIIADQDARFRDSRKRAEAALAIAHHKGSEKLLLMNVLGALDVDEDYNVFASVDGEKVNAEEYVGHLKADKDYAGAFPGAGVLGSGSRPSESGGAGFEVPDGIEFIS